MTSEKPKKLPVLRISWNAYCFFFRHFTRFAKLAWLPLCLTIVLQVGFFDVVSRTTFIGPTTFWLVAVVLKVLFPAIILVKWHQFVILGPRRFRNLDSFTLGKAEFRFLAATTALVCATRFAPDYAADVIGMMYFPDQYYRHREVASYLIDFSAYIVFFSLFCRFFVLLPATATGMPWSVGNVWRLTQGNAIRIFTLLAISSGIMAITLSFGYPLVLGLLPNSVALNPGVLGSTAMAYGNVITIFSGGLGATALSLCYRHLTGTGEIVEEGEKTGIPATADP